MTAARILIVDDNADFCRLLGRLIEHLGYSAVTLTSGPDAIAHLSKDVPDLIILDLMMPDMDGLDVLRIVRGDNRLKEVPVIIFSALGDVQIRQKALKAGATDLWLKAGIDFSSLSQRLLPYLHLENHPTA